MGGNVTTSDQMSAGSNSTLGPDPLLFQLEVFLPAHIHTKQLLVAFSTWVIYEMIITFDESVELFWKQKWTLSKGLFFINRYDGIFAMLWFTFQAHVKSPSILYCKISPWIGLAGAFLLVMTLSLALMIRVRALWFSSRLVMGASMVLFILHILAYVIILIYAYATSIIQSNTFPFTGCLVLPTFPKLHVIFITSIVFETCIVVLTFIKSYPLIRQQEARLRLSNILLTDGLLYYFAIIASQALTLIIFLAGDMPLAIPIVTSYPSIAIIIVACNRLFIRLQRVLLSREGNMTTTDVVSTNPWSDSSNTTAGIGTRTFSYGGRKRRTRGPLSTDFSGIVLTEFNAKGAANPNLGHEPP